MNASRIRVGLAVGFLGLALTTGTAAAQICTASVCGEESTTTTEATTTTTVGEELGVGEEIGLPGEAEPESEVASGTETVGGAAAAAPEGTLPFTGGDVAGLAVIGAAAIGAGALLLRRSKTTTA